MMGSCGCKGGMKDGRPCTCNNCMKKYNHGPARERRGEWLNRTHKGSRIRSIGGERFQMLPEGGSGVGASGPYAPKRIMRMRAEILRNKGYNARVIELAGGHTIWLSKKVRESVPNSTYGIDYRPGNRTTNNRSMRKKEISKWKYNKAWRPNDRIWPEGDSGMANLSEENLIRMLERSQLEADLDEAGNPRRKPLLTNADGTRRYMVQGPYGTNTVVPMEPRTTIMSGKKGQDQWWEMLEVLPPSFWMMNSKHDDDYMGWVHHNDADDPLYEWEQGMSNTSDKKEIKENNMKMVSGSFEDAIGHFWDSQSMGFDKKAIAAEMDYESEDDVWVGQEYVKHMPTGRIVTREQLQTMGRDVFTRLGQNRDMRLSINSFEGDIAGGWDHTKTPEVPRRYELMDYMRKMPDGYSTFMMMELSDHAITGESITTQFGRLGGDNPGATYIEKKVVVNDPDTWIQPEELQRSYKINGKKVNPNQKKYNHLQWWVPGSFGVVDGNKNGFDDRVE